MARREYRCARFHQCSLHRHLFLRARASKAKHQQTRGGVSRKAEDIRRYIRRDLFYGDSGVSAGTLFYLLLALFSSPLALSRTQTHFALTTSFGASLRLQNHYGPHSASKRQEITHGCLFFYTCLPLLSSSEGRLWTWFRSLLADGIRIMGYAPHRICSVVANHHHSSRRRDDQ